MNDDARRRLTAALEATDASARLDAALAAGTYPRPEYLEPLVRRCAVEPDFPVREMLTWALIRLDPETTVPRLLFEVGADEPQARSQALHTLSKIGDARAWSLVTPELLSDPAPEVARTAWRLAVGVVPDGERGRLAAELARQLGRGDAALQRSLSRALAELGDDARQAVAAALAHEDAVVRAHALATDRLLDDPEATFDGLLEDARREIARRDARDAGDPPGEPAGA